MSIDVLSTDIPAGTWNIDPSHSEVGFTARHLMSKVRGQFEKFEGQIVTGDTPSATASIDLNSINTREENRDAHLRSGDFFEVETYPTMSFAHAKVVKQDGDDFVVEGDLTIKDVTRRVSLKVGLDGVANDPFGNTKLAVTAKTEIDREDFGLTWNVALESGGVLVSKKITIEIETQAVLQKA
jgi:polyisoprenoid-binding protein YceI